MSVALLAAVKGYSTFDVEPWVISLNRSGFKGKKYVLVYDNNEELINYFHKHNIEVILQTDEGLSHIATQRFRDYAILLSSEKCNDIDYVIHTDIRDVVFQTNPGKWVLDNIGDQEIIASGEGIKYRHEDWNGEGVQYQFGKEYFDEFVDYETLCSGVIAGTKDGFISLCEAMTEIAFYTEDIGGFIDQHFYNIALRKIFNEVTNFVPPTKPWAANLGTLIAIPMNNPDWSTGPRTGSLSYERFREGSFIDNMLCGLPRMISGQVCTPAGEPYAIVHQYDRYMPWKNELIENFSVTKYVS